MITLTLVSTKIDLSTIYSVTRFPDVHPISDINISVLEELIYKNTPNEYFVTSENWPVKLSTEKYSASNSFDVYI